MFLHVMSFILCLAHFFSHLTYATRNFVSFLFPLILFSFVSSSILFLACSQTSKIEPNMMPKTRNLIPSCSEIHGKGTNNGLNISIFCTILSWRVHDEWFGSKLTPIRARAPPPGKKNPPEMAQTRNKSPKGFVFRPPRNLKIPPKSHFGASTSTFYIKKLIC